MPATPATRTDDEVLAGTDVAVLLRYGLTQDAFHTALFGDGAVAAAVTLDRLGVVPRSVAYVAEIVRAGGLAYAAELPEPLPSEEAAPRTCATGWGAAPVATDPNTETRAARWLDAVAELIGLRRGSRAATSATGPA